MRFICNSRQFQVQLSSLDTTFVWLWWETSTPRNWQLLWIANLDKTEQTVRESKKISINSSEFSLSVIHHCQHCHQCGHKSCITALAIKQTPIFWRWWWWWWWWWWCNACIRCIHICLPSTTDLTVITANTHIDARAASNYIPWWPVEWLQRKFIISTSEML